MNQPLDLTLSSAETPIGTMLLVADAEAQLRAADWSDYEPRMHRLLQLHYGAAYRLTTADLPEVLMHAIESYFAGDLAALDCLSVRTAGTPFQREVWAALRQIKHGTTLSYGLLAARIGKPSAFRAVGLANGSNPVGLVVPCHRVVGAKGALTGYAGGLERKRWLLEHEREHASASTR